MSVATVNTITIVGGGQAGAHAARALRDAQFRGGLALVGDEAHAPYERPPLSKAVLAGTAAAETTRVFDPETFAALGLQWHRGVRAVALDRPARCLVLDDGRRLAFDRLILCTGGRAVRPPIPGIDRPGVHTLRTLDDCARLRQCLHDSRRVGVVGGGWIGLEVAATARRLGKSVTLFEAAGRLCARAVPPAVSEHLLALHRGEGVDVRLGSPIARIDEADGRALCLQPTHGPAATVDTVVVGAGLAANDQLARDAGLACDDGVLVDEQCRSSDPVILAAGDVARAPNSWAGRRLRLESWQNAQEQATVAAHTALGLPARHDPLPWFWSDQFDTNIQIHGVPGPQCRPVLRGSPATGSFLLFFMDDAIVRGIVAFNAARELRRARHLVERRIPISEARLADPRFTLAAA